MTPHDRPDDPDQTYDRINERDSTARTRGDWWTALTDWLAGRPQADGRDAGADGPVIAHRGPDGRIYYGCLIPPGAVPIRANPPDARDDADGAHDARRGYAAEHATEDVVDRDDGAGW